MNKEDENDIDSFKGWDKPVDDLFSLDDKKAEPDDVDVLEKEDDKKDDKKKVEKEPDLFGISDDDGKVDDDADDKDDDVDNKADDKEDKKKAPALSDVDTIKYLKEKGIIDYDLEEGEEITESNAEDFLEDRFDEVIESRVKSLFEELPDVVKELNKYVLNGGNVTTFINSLSKNTNSKITDDIDLTDENNQELVIREMLLEEDNDKDEIDTQIEYYKDSNKLETIAQKKHNKWKEKRKKEKINLLKEQEKIKLEEKQEIREAKNNTSEFLSENEEINGLRFNRQDKRILPSYMNDKAIKLDNGSSITLFQKELFYDVPKNIKAFTQLASLLKNRNKDGTFNFDTIIKNAESKVSKSIKDNVRRTKKKTPSNTQGIKQKAIDNNLSRYF